MKVTFLGSGCWQGIPAPFCDDEISRKVEWGTKDFRLRTSLLIETESGKTIVIEITPDIRIQAWKFKLKRPDAFFISHWHFDHLYGLLELDLYSERYAPVVYGSRTTRDWYQNSMSHVKVDFKKFTSYEPIEIDEVEITPVSVDHVPGTDGFICKNKLTGKSFVYLSDLYAIPEQTRALLGDVEAIIADATYLEGKPIKDETHFEGRDLLAYLKQFEGKEIILTNIGSFNNMTHEQLQEKHAPHVIAYDGLVRTY